MAAGGLTGFWDTKLISIAANRHKSDKHAQKLVSIITHSNRRHRTGTR